EDAHVASNSIGARGRAGHARGGVEGGGEEVGVLDAIRAARRGAERKGRRVIEREGEARRREVEREAHRLVAIERAVLLERRLERGALRVIERAGGADDAVGRLELQAIEAK